MVARMLLSSFLGVLCGCSGIPMWLLASSVWLLGGCEGVAIWLLGH